METKTSHHDFQFLHGTIEEITEELLNVNWSHSNNFLKKDSDKGTDLKYSNIKLVVSNHNQIIAGDTYLWMLVEILQILDISIKGFLLRAIDLVLIQNAWG